MLLNILQCADGPRPKNLQPRPISASLVNRALTIGRDGAFTAAGQQSRLFSGGN